MNLSITIRKLVNTNELCTKLKSPISSTDDVQIGRKLDYLKAQTLLFPLKLKSAPEDLNISRYGDFEFTRKINLINKKWIWFELI